MKSLYLICPTDFLESTLNQMMEGEKFYCTCLGNQHCLYHDTMLGIHALISMYSIERILFATKNDNPYLEYLIQTNDLLIENKIAENWESLNNMSMGQKSKSQPIDRFLCKQVGKLFKELQDFDKCKIGYILFNNDNLNNARKINIMYPYLT